MNYQLTFLVSLKLEAEQALSYQEKIINQLKELGAEIIKASEIKEQGLAYPIRGERKVWLVNLVFALDSKKVNAVEEMLNHEELILRSMISRHPVETKEVQPAVDQSIEKAAIEKPTESDEAKTSSEGLDQKINEILDW